MDFFIFSHLYYAKKTNEWWTKFINELTSMKNKSHFLA